MAIDQLTFADVLAGAGLLPGPDGFDLRTLERFAQMRGWTWTTAPTAARPGRPGEWIALIFAPWAASGCRVSTNLVAHSTGRSEPEALAQALAQALAKNTSPPSVEDDRSGGHAADALRGAGAAPSGFAQPNASRPEHRSCSR